MRLLVPRRTEGRRPIMSLNGNTTIPDVHTPGVPEDAEPIILVVMGVSGSGKTTVGRRIAEQLGWPFYEGDDLHPKANVKKMEGGEPLADIDRQPWLEEIRDLAGRLAREGRSAVIACSALKRAYRELIRSKVQDAMQFVYLKGGYQQIKARIEERDNHYMPAELLQSQFDALQEPTPEEHIIEVNIAQPPDALVHEVVQQLNAST